ncbi:MAG: CapA family protein, partial [Acidimicrobiales bacterium]
REQPAIPLDRAVGWTIFFSIVLLCFAAFFANPSGSALDGIAATDIGENGIPTVAVDAPGSSPATNPESADGPADGSISTEVAQPIGDGVITIAFTGDVLVHESVAQSAATEDGFDFSTQFGEVETILSDADLALCHLETPISSDNSALSYYPAFLVPSELADGIEGAGFAGCSVASNHALDAGESGVRSTFTELQRVTLGIAGVAGPNETRGRAARYEVGGVSIGHLSYAYGFNGLEPSGRNIELVNLLDASAIEADAASLKADGVDFVVVSAHWGSEYSTELTSQQAELGPRLIASPNIDLVIGHHAHVVQQIVEYDGQYVAYGLGNFLSNQSAETCSPCPTTTQDGVILLVDIALASSGGYEVAELRAVATWVDRSNGHVIRVADDDSRQRTIAALTASGVGLS